MSNQRVLSKISSLQNQPQMMTLGNKSCNSISFTIIDSMNYHLLNRHLCSPISLHVIFNNPHDTLRQVTSSFCTLKGSMGILICSRLPSLKGQSCNSKQDSFYFLLPCCLLRDGLPMSPKEKCLFSYSYFKETIHIKRVGNSKNKYCFHSFLQTLMGQNILEMSRWQN